MAHAPRRKMVTVDAGDAVALSKFDPTCLHFDEPAGGPPAMLCKGHVGPGHGILNLHLPAVRAVRVAPIKDTLTLTVAAPRRAVRFVMDLDRHCLDTVSKNIEAWFARNVSPPLVEEYFSTSTEVTKRGSVVARFRLVGTDMLPKLHTDRDYDVTLRFVGLQFHKHSFCVLWKLKKCLPARSTPTSSWMPDGEADDDSSSVCTDELIVPSADDVQDIVRSMATALDAHVARHTAAITAHRGQLARVKAARQRLELVTSAPGGPTMRDLDELSDHIAGLDAEVGA